MILWKVWAPLRSWYHFLLIYHPQLWATRVLHAGLYWLISLVMGMLVGMQFEIWEGDTPYYVVPALVAIVGWIFACYPFRVYALIRQIGTPETIGFGPISGMVIMAYVIQSWMLMYVFDPGLSGQVIEILSIPSTVGMVIWACLQFLWRSTFSKMMLGWGIGLIWTLLALMPPIAWVSLLVLHAMLASSPYEHGGTPKNGFADRLFLGMIWVMWSVVIAQFAFFFAEVMKTGRVMQFETNMTMAIAGFLIGGGLTYHGLVKKRLAAWFLHPNRK
ncbi:hypothetical protein [Pontibacter sp. G13]|uniref:hypothetical protein n=1 Tax=Pontibacter sp. G13 TaxID=3074898 RepID=UPI00288AA779|nr:hypothetical protein [Pontibacter sp. G13]WNJ16309.1 hypothetical protein RJD25_15705 [Pontibacter sp. G13]